MKEKLQICQHCGCMPKPDEWSSETLCIDCINTFYMIEIWLIFWASPIELVGFKLGSNLSPDHLGGNSYRSSRRVPANTE